MLRAGAYIFHVDSLATGRERFQPAQCPLEKFVSAREVAPLQVIEPHSHLEDTAVEFANRCRFSPPGGFQEFMRFKIFTGIEELQPAQGSRRKRHICQGIYKIVLHDRRIIKDG